MPKTSKHWGWVKGEPFTYLRGHSHEHDRAVWSEALWIVDLATGCWLWQGTLDPLGYGRFGRKLAHRCGYERHIGPIPAGLVLDHLCVNPPCVNPAHLEPVTQSVNMQRYHERRRQLIRLGYCRSGE